QAGYSTNYKQPSRVTRGYRGVYDPNQTRSVLMQASMGVGKTPHAVPYITPKPSFIGLCGSNIASSLIGCSKFLACEYLSDPLKVNELVLGIAVVWVVGGGWGDGTKRLAVKLIVHPLRYQGIPLQIMVNSFKGSMLLQSRQKGYLGRLFRGDWINGRWDSKVKSMGNGNAMYSNSTMVMIGKGAMEVLDGRLSIGGAQCYYYKVPRVSIGGEHSLNIGSSGMVDGEVPSKSRVQWLLHGTNRGPHFPSLNHANTIASSTLK
ncbi:hypothetical protein G9A89_000610, partial [Geosiphon pyriformis]